MLINRYSMEIKNAYIDNKEISINRLSQNSDYILLTKINEDKFKIMTVVGRVVYMKANELKRNILENNISNCLFERAYQMTLYSNQATHIMQKKTKNSKPI